MSFLCKRQENHVLMQKKLALKRKSKELSQDQGKTLGQSFGFHFNDFSTTVFNKILWVGDNLTNPCISANEVLEIDYKTVFNPPLVKKKKTPNPG